MGLAGGMVWDTSMDDFRNRCGDGKNPFLTAMRTYLSPSDDDGSDEKDKDKDDKDKDDKDKDDKDKDDKDKDDKDKDKKAKSTYCYY